MAIRLSIRNALHLLRENAATPQFAGDLSAAMKQSGGDACLLGDALIAHGGALPEILLRETDVVWEARKQQQQQQQQQHGRAAVRRPIQADLPGLWLKPAAGDGDGPSLVVWRGDITTLAVDAVVNAANEAGLGCFQPAHRCIDNVLHRAAGPRLRAACREALARREGGPTLGPAGAPPLVTPAFHLPSRAVLHVVGPRVNANAGPDAAKGPTPQQAAALARCYTGCLDACKREGFRSVAFNCVSTGLFGYPASDAAHVALGAVREWLGRSAAHAAALDLVVFDVFTAEDHALYRAAAPSFFAVAADTEPPVARATQPQPRPLQQTVQAATPVEVAAKWLAEADRVIVCAGAGMSGGVPGRGVYTSERDFRANYPWFPGQWGYRTSYECMGLWNDPHVPWRAKWGLQATHMHKQRYAWAPNAGYGHLKALLADKGDNVFVYTSNVDGAFLRDPAQGDGAGDGNGVVPRDRIYRPQGDWENYQCKGATGVEGPCTPTSVFPSRPMLDATLPHVDAAGDGMLPRNKVPHCPKCGGVVFGNVRGGRWFLHAPYDAEQDRFVAFVEAAQREADAEGKTLVVLEVGAGFNTPTVTRFPMESVVRGTHGARLVRVNPDHSDVPRDLRAEGRAVGLARGWQALEELNTRARAYLAAGDAGARARAEAAEAAWRAQQQQQQQGGMRGHRYRHCAPTSFDWREALQSLRR